MEETTVLQEQNAEETTSAEATEEKVNENVDEKELEQRIAEDFSWFEENVGGDFESFIKSDEFRDFMDGTAMDIRSGMEKFVKFKGADYVKGNFKKPVNYTTTGSAKDSGAGDLKEYYTPDDVDRLTAKDLDDPVIFERVRQSMMKWK